MKDKLLKIITSPKELSKYLICFTAVMHLIISHLQISSISALTDQICGFAMFFFILLGFACLFNALRSKVLTTKSFILSLVMLLATIGFGAWLLSIYFNAFSTQNNLKLSQDNLIGDLMKSPILPGITVSCLVILLYVVGIILLIIGFIFEKKHINLLAKDEDEE